MGGEEGRGGIGGLGVAEVAGFGRGGEGGAELALTLSLSPQGEGLGVSGGWAGLATETGAGAEAGRWERLGRRSPLVAWVQLCDRYCLRGDGFFWWRWLAIFLGACFRSRGGGVLRHWYGTRQDLA